MKLHTDTVWFITGCSSGLGFALADKVLANGFRAVITARDAAALEPLARAGGKRCLALALDVTDAVAAQAAVDAAMGAFGAIDVLVNNAGRGFFTSIEHARMEDIRAMFEINFFGLVDLTQRVLPTMRAAERGHVVNISSTGGLLGRAGSGFYAASKFAVEGFSEALAQETQAFGIGVTLVEPSGFRTRFAATLWQGDVTGYETTAGRRMAQTVAGSGMQRGDPARAAEAIIQAVGSAQPPLRLPLGADAVVATQHKADMLTSELASWEAVARAADFPEGT